MINIKLLGGAFLVTDRTDFTLEGYSPLFSTDLEARGEINYDYSLPTKDNDVLLGFPQLPENTDALTTGYDVFLYFRGIPYAPAKMYIKSANHERIEVYFTIGGSGAIDVEQNIRDLYGSESITLPTITREYIVLRYSDTFAAKDPSFLVTSYDATVEGISYSEVNVVSLVTAINDDTATHKVKAVLVNKIPVQDIVLVTDDVTNEIIIANGTLVGTQDGFPAALSVSISTPQYTLVNTAATSSPIYDQWSQIYPNSAFVLGATVAENIYEGKNPSALSELFVNDRESFFLKINTTWQPAKQHNRVVSPQLWLLDVINKIFTVNGVTSTGVYSTDARLNRIFLWNNYAIDEYINPEGVQWLNIFKKSIQKRELLPDMSVGDFLKAIQALLNLSYYWNKQSGALEVYAVDTILNDATVEDWSTKEVAKSTNVSPIKYEGYSYICERDENDGFSTPQRVSDGGGATEVKIDAGTIFYKPFTWPKTSHAYTNDPFDIDNRDFRLRLLFYLPKTSTGTPFTNSSGIDIDGVRQVDFDLTLAGSYGVVNKFHKPYFDLLKSSKPMVKEFLLTDKDVIDFNVLKKKRIGAVVFYIKKYSITTYGKSLWRLKAECVKIG